MTYPKWVSRGYGIGEVLCLNEEEEFAIVADREARSLTTGPVYHSSPAGKVIGEFVVTDMSATSITVTPAAPQRKKPGPKPKVK